MYPLFGEIPRCIFYDQYRLVQRAPDMLMLHPVRNLLSMRVLSHFLRKRSPRKVVQPSSAGICYTAAESSVPYEQCSSYYTGNRPSISSPAWLIICGLPCSCTTSHEFVMYPVHMYLLDSKLPNGSTPFIIIALPLLGVELALRESSGHLIPVVFLGGALFQLLSVVWKYRGSASTTASHQGSSMEI